MQIARDAEDGNGDLLAARTGDHGEEVTVGVDRRVGDDVEIFDHGDADVGVEGIALEAAAADREIGGDCAGRDLNDGAGGAGEIEVCWDLAEESLGESWIVANGGHELRAEDFEAATRDGGTGVQAVEMRSVYACWVEQSH